MSEVPRGSGFITAPYDDVAEVDRYSGTRAGPILQKFVLWQAQRHSYAVGHFTHCSSYVFCLRQISSTLTEQSNSACVFLSEMVDAVGSGARVMFFGLSF